MPQEQRRLAAIMFTDMVGYTLLGQRNESLSLALVGEQRKLVRPILARHNGREVKTIGDAFLVEFPSALDAVRCAYDIQRAAREFNVTLDSDKKLHLRIGIHLGDVTESEGDISGDAVNVASRIEPLAEDGGVSMTRQVYDHVQNKFELPMTSIGFKTLKNVSIPMEVYKMTMPWGETLPGQSLGADKRRIAVLPFASLSPDPNDEYFADGLTEELITKLSEMEGLRVIARTSIMNYKNKQKNVSEIGKELSAGSVVEGSVRKAGNRVRITAQLIDTGNEEHMWASTYDRELDDVFAIQSDVASKVAGSLQAGILQRREKKDTEDTRAYMFYIRAMQLAHESTGPSLKEAIALLEQAVAEDPKFARAYAGLSMAWGRMITGGYFDFESGVKLAEDNARRAVELAPERAETHSALSRVFSFQDKFDKSLEETQRALQINPNLAEAHLGMGIEYSTFGSTSDALEAFLKAYELDPLNFPSANFLAWTYIAMGRTEEALEVLGKARELNSNNPRVYTSLSEVYMTRGEFDRASDMLEIGRKISPDEIYVHLDQGILFALTGKSDEAEGEIAYLNTAISEGVRLYGMLFINVALGRLDPAFEALKRQAEIHSWPYNIAVHPILKDLRADPRYLDFCKTVGLSR